MKALLVLLLCLDISTVHARAGHDKFTVPDLKKIEKESQDPKSQHYYPNLFKRYEDNDTTLSLEDFRYLYYGSAYQTGYSSMAGSIMSTRDSINSIFRKDSLINDDYLRMEKFVKMNLTAEPYSLDNLNMLTSIYKKTGRRDLYLRLKYKLNKVADAILSTGDGKTASSAWYVINISHEYDVLRLFGLKFGGQQSLIEGPAGPCDYLTLGENEQDIKGLYFNVTITMGDLDKMLGGSSSKKSKKKK